MDFKEYCYSKANHYLSLIHILIIGKITEVYTSSDYKSVKLIADESETGAATNIISGLSVGMKSTVIPIILIAIEMCIRDRTLLMPQIRKVAFHQ